MKETRVKSLCQEILCRRERQSTPVFLPRESHGQRSLDGYSPRGYKELDTIEVTTHTHTIYTFMLSLDSRIQISYVGLENVN